MKVSVSKGVTINIGNYESVRVDCTVEAGAGEYPIENARVLIGGVNDFLREEIHKLGKDPQRFLPE